jgi:hypothetical protein
MALVRRLAGRSPEPAAETPAVRAVMLDKPGQGR